MDGVKQLVLADPRINVSKKILLQKILTETNFKRAQVDENSLWVMTDSALRNKPLQSLNGIDNKTILFSFPKKNIVVADWLNYVKTARNIPALSSGKTYKEVFEQYLQKPQFLIITKAIWKIIIKILLTSSMNSKKEICCLKLCSEKYGTLLQLTALD